MGRSNEDKPPQIDAINAKGSANLDVDDPAFQLGKGCERVGRDNKYILGRKIGVGSFACVKEAYDTERHVKVAVKLIPVAQLKEQQPLKDRVAAELQVLSKVKHPCCNQLLDVFIDNHRLGMVLELAERNLLDYVNSSKVDGIPEQIFFKFFWQLVSGLEFLHNNKICHRDIKPENILLDKYMNIHIADFGMARFYESTAESRCGSIMYCAPEVLDSKNKGGYCPRKADAWSLGALLYVARMHKMPFSGKSIPEVLMSTKSGNPLPFSNVCTEDFKELINSLLVYDGEKRRDITSLRKSPYWINGCREYNLSITGCHHQTQVFDKIDSSGCPGYSTNSSHLINEVQSVVSMPDICPPMKTNQVLGNIAKLDNSVRCTFDELSPKQKNASSKLTTQVRGKRRRCCFFFV